jgi:hypothetical protein
MRKAISIVLSVLLLASSSGIAYAQHYCGDFEMLSKITLGEEHLSCGMAMEAPGCEDNDTDDHNCCDNQYTQVHTDDNFAKANFNIIFQQPFIAQFVSVFVLIQLDAYKERPNLVSTYHPPPLYKDIPVLYETFLI